MIIPKLKGRIAFGADYNPEQWAESVWEEDVALMKEAGVNLLSLAIFSWAKLQPAPDRWNFAWLDRILDLLAENEIFVCLATATASPPSWLVKAHPDILPENAEGVTLAPGSRQHYSPSSADYRQAASRLVEKIAKRYASHPALAAWHINNEYACHLHECHNASSTKAFRSWLKSKYKTIENLNEAWGTTFWSQIYADWDEIQTPRKAPYFQNPSQQIDFKRFTSDAFLELFSMEKAILNKHAPGIPVTTNFMGFFKPLDYHRWSEEVDFTAWDSYPDPVDENAARILHAAGNDLTRSLKPDSPFVLMEQATSAVNWRDINLPKRPGLNRLWSMQTIARGGDGVMYFQWRASKAGTEKYHSSIIQHIGAERSRVFKETSQLGAELKQIECVSDSLIQSDVAIIFDWHSWWSIEVDSRPSRIDYLKSVLHYYDWFYKNNIPVDFVSPRGDLDKYKLALAPSLYLLDDSGANAIAKYVEQGGTLLATYFSGIVDENDHVVLGGYPGQLKTVLGLWIEEWHPYPDGKGNSLKLEPSDEAFSCKDWADIIHLEGAKALARFESDFFAGSPALTQNQYGKGDAFYLGTRIGGDALDTVLDLICRKTALVESILDAPVGVEVTLRHSPQQRFLFLLNHTDHIQTIDLKSFAGIDILNQLHVSGKISLNPIDVSVIQLH